MAEREIVYVVSAEDKATKVFRVIATESDKTTAQVESGAKKAEEAQRSLAASSKDIVIGFSGVATAAFSLYQSFDALEKAEYRVQKANVAMDSTANSANAAQIAYTAAVTKYGSASEEAAQALAVLKTAEDRHALSVDSAKIAQDNLNDTQTRAYLQIIPAGITMIASLATAWKGLRDLGPGVVAAFGRIQTSSGSLKLAMAGLAGAAGIGAVLTGYMAITAMDDDVQLAFTLITAAIAGVTVAFWLMAGSAAAAWALATFGTAIPIIAGIVISTAAIVYAAGEEMQKNSREQAKRDFDEQMRYNQQLAESQAAMGAFAAPEEQPRVQMPNESYDSMMVRLGYWKGAGGEWVNVPSNYNPSGGGTQAPLTDQEKKRLEYLEQERYNREVAEAEASMGTFEPPRDQVMVRRPDETTEEMMLRLGYWRDNSGAWTNIPTNYSSNSAPSTMTEMGERLDVPRGASGMDITEPTLLLAGEAGEEILLNPEQTKAYKSGGGRLTVNNNKITVIVDRALDDDLLVEKVVREIRRRTGMNI